VPTVFQLFRNRPLADFLPAVTITAKNLATEITNFNVSKEDMQGEDPITVEHVQNNQDVRDLLLKRGIRPQTLPPEEDLIKLERRVTSPEKKIEGRAGNISPQLRDNKQQEKDLPGTGFPEIPPGRCQPTSQSISHPAFSRWNVAKYNLRSCRRSDGQRSSISLNAFSNATSKSGIL
jgi:hypothetical protein